MSVETGSDRDLNLARDYIKSALENISNYEEDVAKSDIEYCIQHIESAELNEWGWDEFTEEYRQRILKIKKKLQKYLRKWNEKDQHWKMYKISKQSNLLGYRTHSR